MRRLTTSAPDAEGALDALAALPPSNEFDTILMPRILALHGDGVTVGTIAAALRSVGVTISDRTVARRISLAKMGARA